MTQKTLATKLSAINSNSDTYSEYREAALSEVDHAIASETDKEKLDTLKTIRLLIDKPDTDDIEYVHNQVLDMLE